MANQIENIYAKQAEDQLKKILDGLTSIHKKQMELNNNAIDFYGGRTASSVSEMKKVEVSMQKLQAQAERNRIAELKLATQREKAFDKYEAQLSKEQAKLQASQNLYNKTQQQLNKVQAAYNNLAAKKERYNNLSTYEEARLKTLQVITEKYNTTLKSVDATVGKYTRNVGNYAGAFNPVSNSINQLTREMPAFANSVQTGFMAISNNLPIFFDAMQQTIAQQKELQKQGLPSKNALQILAGGLFTLGTALSVGITLLTVYGKDIVNFISKTLEAKNATKSFSDQLNELNEAKLKASENAGKEISELDLLYKNTKNVYLSINERKKAVDKLQELYPKYLGNISDENILNGQAEKQYWKLRDAILAKYTAQAISDKLAENSRERLDDYMNAQQRLVNAERDLQNELKANNSYREKYVTKDIDGKVLSIKKGYEELGALRLLKFAINERNQAEIELANKKKQALKEDSLLINTYNKLVRQSADLNIEKEKETKNTNKNTKSTKENTKAIKENNNVRDDVRFALIGSVEWFEKLKSALLEEQKQVSQNNSKWEEYQKKIDQAQKSIDAITKSVKELDGVSLDLGGSEFLTDIDGDKLARQGDELLAWYKEFRQGFQDDFWANSGFDKIQFIIENFDNLKQSGVDMALALSEAFQQAFNTISQMSDANYQRMYDNLERQRDTSILFAGESATARAEIERVYEERRKRIQRQQAESQKRLAMFNIAINTAQGITSALAMLPPNIPLAVTIGVIGAAQLAMTASQPIPQFAIGTQNAPEGLAWTDEKGAELHTDKNGKIKDLGSDKGARLKKLSKGDKIYTASQTKKILDLYSFNKDYDNIMLTNGIAPAPQVGQTINLEPLNARLDKLTSVVANKSEVTIMNNESGTRYYERVNGQRRELVNSVLTMKSRSVR